MGSRLRWIAPVALVLAIPAGFVAAADISLDGGVGEERHRPLEARDIPRDGYELGIGELEVDLRDVRWPASGELRVKTGMGIGETLVLVPRDVCVLANADLGAGHVDVLGDDAEGVDVDYHAGGRASSDRKRLILDSELGVGELRVEQDRHGPSSNPCEDGA
jgi:hypothetical protein